MRIRGERRLQFIIIILLFYKFIYELLFVIYGGKNEKNQSNIYIFDNNGNYCNCYDFKINSEY